MNRETKIKIRSLDLRCAKIALSTYQWSKNPIFMEYAKFFGKQSKELNEQINNTRAY